MRRYINTIKFLKPIQIYYRLYYIIRVKIEYKYSKESNSNILKLQKSIRVKSSYSNGEFSFLNLSKRFDKIDWNYSRYGKLWTYNLTYFDFLSKREDISLIYDFIDNIDSIKDGLEPFPISLRGVNWIKFLSLYNIRDKKIDDSLYAQYYILMDNLEYHLLGNHLLENGFSLLFGGYYFRDYTLYHKAEEILFKELDEQILSDGGHFELSPMYHQIMLFRVLDSINLLKNSNWIEESNLLEFLIEKAEIMLGWLDAISYRDGDIPLLNDSTKDIAPTTIELFDYAKRLKVERAKIRLKESGYRKILKDNYELILDIGSISAKYIAGHTHSDIFNFELRVNGKPFIVDSGISTYEVSNRRDIERSTKAHNTVEVNGKNQIEVWGGFRVGDRADIFNIVEADNYIEATHNGYGDILHTRRWSFYNDRVVIEDRLSRDSSAIFRLHFHNLISKEYIIEHIKTDSRLNFSKYYLSDGFNSRIKANSIDINFRKYIKVTILI